MDTIFQEDVSFIAENINNKQKLSGKCILISGGSGFLGNYIVESLLEINTSLQKPCTIISVDNYITSKKDKKRKKNKNLILKTFDIKKPLNLKRKIDLIIHAAGIASPVYYKKYPLETLDVAVQGTRNLLDLAVKKKVESFLFFSSSEIYGDPPADKIPTKETYNGNVSSIGPRSCYDESKRLGETLCYTYYHLYKVPVKIVRPFNIYGPKMHKNDYRVIPTFIKNALLGKELPIHSAGNQTRSFCYVTDSIIELINVLLSSKNGEVFNVGNDEQEISMNKLSRILGSVFENKIGAHRIEYPDNYPTDEPKRRCPDISKIKKETGYIPSINLETGLRRTVDWCKKNWKI